MFYNDSEMQQPKFLPNKTLLSQYYQDDPSQKK